MGGDILTFYWLGIFLVGTVFVGTVFWTFVFEFYWTFVSLFYLDSFGMKGSFDHDWFPFALSLIIFDIVIFLGRRSVLGNKLSLRFLERCSAIVKWWIFACSRRISPSFSSNIPRILFLFISDGLNSIWKNNIIFSDSSPSLSFSINHYFSSFSANLISLFKIYETSYFI